jgi:hypothetical protein
MDYASSPESKLNLTLGPDVGCLILALAIAIPDLPFSDPMFPFLAGWRVGEQV